MSTVAAPSPESLVRFRARALELARRRQRGGDSEPVFKRPFLDAAFNRNIFLWDSCFIAAWAKHHVDKFPVHQSLDNFYERQEPDGFICREYLPDGAPLWPRSHPIAANPPLLSWAELELHSRTGDLARLARVYPALKRFRAWLRGAFRGDDGLYFGDMLGSGMDNIPRYPRGWEDDGKGIPLGAIHPSVEHLRGWLTRFSVWNVQGRFCDFSAQNALDALCLARVARLLGHAAEAEAFAAEHAALARAINAHCWDEAAGFYFDLAYGQRLPRFHIGAYWTLLAEVAPPERAARLVAHLEDPRKFGRPVPVPALAADDPDYRPWGAYWHGGVWAPTTYMVLRGLAAYGHHDLARRLARRFHDAVFEVWRATDTFWENYSPEFAAYGQPAHPDFCGWTALVPLAIGPEFLD